MFAASPKGPQQVETKIREVLQLLTEKGLEYEQVLIEEQSQRYPFLLPHSPYYQLYTRALNQHINHSSYQSQQAAVPPEVVLEGTLEDISVGAMSEILKQQIQQVDKSIRQNGTNQYQPQDPSVYEHRILVNPTESKLQQKIVDLTNKYKHLLAPSPEPHADKETSINAASKEAKRQLGTNADGSLGPYGGSKYQGLGLRDEFNLFRKQQSQNYYSAMQDKSRPN